MRMPNLFKNRRKDSVAVAIWKVVLPYTLFASLWILVSDALVIFLFRDPAMIAAVNTLKGWAFVVVTSILLSVLLRRRIIRQSWVETNLRTLINTIPDPVWLKSPDGVYLSCNGAFERLYGTMEAQMIGRTDYDFVDATLADSFRSKDREAIAAGRASINEESVTFSSDGHCALMETIRTPMYDSSGELTGVLGVARDITGRKRAEELLSEKNSEMERFIYTVSHDLKSPLITVRTFLGYLEQDLAASDSDRVRQDLAYVRSATDKMEHMLAELLEVSRVGRMVNPPTAVMFRELAAEALDTVAGRIASRGVKVILAGEDVALYGDRPRLVEILQNLVENAVKCMGEEAEPQIEIGSGQRGAEIVFSVRDNGIGIEPPDREKIFDLFFRLNPHSEGSGLGLALVRRIVEMYRGRIWVESEGGGKGSTFCFTLPGALKSQTGNRSDAA